MCLKVAWMNTILNPLKTIHAMNVQFGENVKTYGLNPFFIHTRLL